MLGNKAEQQFFGELEIARAKYQKNLIDLDQTIAFCEQSDGTGRSDAERTTAALYTVTRRLTHAGEVYDMALLQLTNYWRKQRINRDCRTR